MGKEKYGRRDAQKQRRTKGFVLTTLLLTERQAMRASRSPSRRRSSLGPHGRRGDRGRGGRRGNGKAGTGHGSEQMYRARNATLLSEWLSRRRANASAMHGDGRPAPSHLIRTKRPRNIHFFGMKECAGSAFLSRFCIRRASATSGGGTRARFPFHLGTPRRKIRINSARVQAPLRRNFVVFIYFRYFVFSVVVFFSVRLCPSCVPGFTAQQAGS